MTKDRMKYEVLNRDLSADRAIYQIRSTWIHGIYKTEERHIFTVIIDPDDVVTIWHPSGDQVKFNSADDDFDPEYQTLLNFITDNV